MATVHLRKGDVQVRVRIPGDPESDLRDIQRVWIAPSTKATAMNGWVVRSFEDYDGNSFVPAVFDVFLSQQSALASVMDHNWDVIRKDDK